MAEREIKNKVPHCRYNNGVDCPYVTDKHCCKCGWLYGVSYRRIKREYGIEATEYLSKPDEKE